MKVPLSWLKDFVDIDLTVEELAHRLTMAGLEVEEVRYVGFPLPGPKGSSIHLETKYSGFSWEPDKIVVGAILEVQPHPNADRLVLCKLDDGVEVHTVLTGAPNLFPFRGKGPLDSPLKVAYAREGATIIDAYKPGNNTTKLKRRKIRGFESYSMACSERELGISDEHEGIIILDDDAPVGEPLVDYIGDAVFDIAITPNIARDANIIGVAREVAAVTGKELRYPDLTLAAERAPIDGRVSIEITEPDLNPRFVLGLIEDITIKTSPYRAQLRLTLAGMRPINNVVDATNYAMLELGEPLHAFDFDILQDRAGGKAPTIITRAAVQDEELRTLDGVDRKLDDFTVLVCDQSGPLALAGVMGGEESEVNDETTTILLEGAAWNMINTRRTVLAQKLQSEAAYRFSRGVHPTIAEHGVLRGLELMRQWGGGKIASGLVDKYPKTFAPSRNVITPKDVQRWLGIDLPPQEIAKILENLDFSVELDGENIIATTPDHRLDIDDGVIGKADLMEEIARIYGYDKIPETRLSDHLPPQTSNLELELEERVRDLLTDSGLMEVITYRMTTPESEARRLPKEVPPDDYPYLSLVNPITADRKVMRHSLLSSVLQVVAKNTQTSDRIAIFEIGPVFLSSEGNVLPDEISRLVIALTGTRAMPTWQGVDTAPMDFYDLKGIIINLLNGMYISEVQFEQGKHPTFHPGKCANIVVGEKRLGTIGELHPRVAENYDLPPTAVLIGIIDMQTLMKASSSSFTTQPVPAYPPVIEDLALVMDEGIPAAQVEHLIYQTGGPIITNVQLFDVYQGEQIGNGQKSLAYRVTYQAADRTLTDKQVAKIRNRIVQRLKREIQAELRS